MKSIMASLAENYQQEYMQKGMKTKAMEIAENMLFQLHLGIEEVKKATGLSRKALERLQATH